MAYIWTKAGITYCAQRGQLARLGNPSPGDAVQDSLLAKTSREDFALHLQRGHIVAASADSNYIWTEVGVMRCKQVMPVYFANNNPVAGSSVHGVTIAQWTEGERLQSYIEQGWITSVASGYIWTEAGIANIARKAMLAQMRNPTPGSNVHSSVLVRFANDVPSWLRHGFIQPASNGGLGCPARGGLPSQQEAAHPKAGCPARGRMLSQQQAGYPARGRMRSQSRAGSCCASTQPMTYMYTAAGIRYYAQNGKLAELGNPAPGDVLPYSRLAKTSKEYLTMLLQRGLIVPASRDANL